MPSTQVSGAAVHFHDGGVAWTPERPALVFIHGAGGDHTLWQQQSRALAQGSTGFNVAALDLPGHGRSADVGGLDSLAAHATWLLAFLDAVKLPRAALVGHSLGACIALEAAAAAPERVTSLALVGVGLTMKVSAELLRDSQADHPQAVRFITSYGHSRATHLGHAPVPGSWLMGAVGALLAAGSPDVLHRDFAVCDAWEGSAAATRVRCPTLVVAGGADRMVPARLGKALVAAIPGARLEVLPGVGHMIPPESPRPLLKLLRAHLRAPE